MHTFMLFRTFDFGRKKGWGFFIGPLQYQTKIKNFQKIMKKHHTEQLHKKVALLHQAPLISLFLTHPVHYFFYKNIIQPFVKQTFALKSFYNNRFLETYIII